MLLECPIATTISYFQCSRMLLENLYPLVVLGALYGELDEDEAEKVLYLFTQRFGVWAGLESMVAMNNMTILDTLENVRYLHLT